MYAFNVSYDFILHDMIQQQTSGGNDDGLDDDEGDPDKCVNASAMCFLTMEDFS